MAFSAIGNFQLVSQIYNYKKHRIACSYKVLPTHVRLFDRKAENDYHWMDAARWAAIEGALWRQLENLAHWQDAKKLHVVLLIDHVNVWIRATETPHPTMPGSEVEPADDLCLDIELKYISTEDIPISDVLSIKRVEVAPSSSTSSIKSAGSGIKQKAGVQEKPSSSKPKRIHTNDGLVALGNQPPIKIKRERGFLSKENSSNNVETFGQVKMRTRSLSRASNRFGKLDEKALAASPSKKLKEKPATSLAVKEKPATSLAVKEKPATSLAVKEKPATSLAVKEKPATSLAVKEKPATSLAVKDKPAPPLPLKEIFLSSAEQLSNDAHLDKPPKVQILLLENMGEADVMATFKRYKEKFDRLFRKRNNKPETLSYKQINHTDIIDILTAAIRVKMVKKLRKTYYTQRGHMSLILNGMLPLWIVLLFKEAYKLSRGDAVRQIKGQVKWSSYLKALDNDPLEFNQNIEYFP